MSVLRKPAWQFSLIAIAAVAAIAAVIGAPAAQSSGQSRAGDRLANFNFRVEIDGVAAGQFSEVSGLSVEQEVVEYRSGEDSTTRKIPGRVKYGDITLKRGYTSTGTLHDWIETNLTGRDAGKGVDRRNGSIVVLNESDEEVARYNFFEAWPSKWKISSLDGKGNDVLVEEVVIVIEWFEEA